MPTYWGCDISCYLRGLNESKDVYTWKYICVIKLCDFITVLLWMILSFAYGTFSGEKWQPKWRFLVPLNHIDSALHILRKINWTHFVSFQKSGW